MRTVAGSGSNGESTISPIFPFVFSFTQLIDHFRGLAIKDIDFLYFRIEIISVFFANSFENDSFRLTKSNLRYLAEFF